MFDFDKITLLDGAMGTLLSPITRPGRPPEELNLTDPAAVSDAHRRYADAGTQIVYTNTFGASPVKLAAYGLDCGEIIAAAVKNAREGVGNRALVALDCGPTGKLMAPAGDMSFDEAYDAFKTMAVYGEQAGADLIVLETFSQLPEIRAALLAVKENTALPVICTMSFDENGRTFSGTGVEAAATVLSSLGADAVGINCSLGPEQLPALIRKMRAVTDKPIVAKPNAGLPDAETGRYALSPERFAALTTALIGCGATAVGGCCGTSPEHIAALAALCAGKTPVRPARDGELRLASAADMIAVTSVTVIGERINPTGKKLFKQALREGDLDYIRREAQTQAAAGAQLLDVNVGLPEIDEKKTMLAAVDAVTGVCPLPLQLDSADPDVLSAALRAYCGKALVNSVNGKKETLDAVLPLVKKYGAAVVGLTLDECGIPETAEKRLEISRRIVAACDKIGIARRDIVIDPLTLTVSAQPTQAAETLKAIGLIKKELGVRTVLGVSNISFGLPARQKLNSAFLAMAAEAGLDMAILNPSADFSANDPLARAVLENRDEGAKSYIAANADAPAAKAEKRPADPAEALYEAVVGARAEEAAKCAAEALKTMAPQEIIDIKLIPALGEVGKRYESGKIFLPTLLACASAASSALDLLRAELEKSGVRQTRGPVVIATVQGDVHDIGKNIAKALLQNYGFEVIDLGRDVPPETVVAEVKRAKAPLVGLSALMTTTVRSMEKTVALLKRETQAKVYVAGAVLTREYAEKMGADFFAADAKESVDIAQRVCP